MQPEQTTLYYEGGGSDKVYKVFLIEKVDGYVVDFAYGRRGSALAHGTKTPDPVDFHRAKALFDNLVKAKISKGYRPRNTPIGGVAAQVVQAVEQKDTGMLPQLLNPIKEQDLGELFKQWSYVLIQTKHDGERRMVSVSATGEIVAANRRGLQVSLPRPIEKALQSLSERVGKAFILDCEDMGEHLVPFDVLHLGVDLKEETTATRAGHLEDLELASEDTETGEKYLQFDTPRAVTNLSALEQWIHAARVSNAEGVCLKDPDATYSIGRPNSGGPALKFKFVESCTCLVLAQNDGKRSVQLGVQERNGGIRFIGNVTIPPNYDIPAPGQLVEIEYLYAYPGEGSLYQPQFKGPRVDMAAADYYDTLKFKE